jgi:hypothetical protein
MPFVVKYTAQFILLFALMTSNAIGQQANNWCFGWRCGFSFSSGEAKFFKSGIYHNTGDSTLGSEASTTVSDCNGNLLFYGNARLVWNRHHKLMPHGILYKEVLGSNSPTLAIPKPQSDSEFYYIFRNNAKLYYGILDMRLDSGRGDIVDTNYKILVDTFNSSAITFTKHANDTDYWLMAKTLWHYRAFRVTKDSIISKKPIMSTYLSSLSDEGEIKFTNKGDAINSNYIEQGTFMMRLYDFNKSTGKVTGIGKPLIERAYNASGSSRDFHVEYSPNDSFIYVVFSSDRYGFSTPYFAQIPRFSSLPYNNIYLIDQKNNAKEPVYSLRLAPDNKIYWASVSTKYIGVVKFPDKKFEACQIIRKYINISPYAAGHNFPTLGFYIPRVSFSHDRLDTSLCGNDTIHFNFEGDTNRAKSFTWYFGDGDSSTLKNPAHHYTKPGWYAVTVVAQTSSCGYKQRYSDSVLIKFNPVLTQNIQSNYYCNRNELTSSFQGKYIDSIYINWGDGFDTISLKDTGQFMHTYHTNGIYKLQTIASNNYCQWKDSIDYSVHFDTLVKGIPMINTTAICGTDTVILSDVGGYDSLVSNRYYLLNTKIIQSSQNKEQVYLNKSGKYYYQLVREYRQGCIDTVPFSDTILVNALPNASIYGIGSSTLCPGDSVILSNQAAKTYLWNTGDTTRQIVVKQSGTFSVTITDSNGCSNTSAPFKIKFHPQPVVTIAENAQHQLQANSQPGATTWRWKLNGLNFSNNTLATIAPKDTGNYSVVITDSNGCQATSGLYHYTYTGFSEQMEGQQSVYIYPNPNAGIFILELPNQQLEQIAITDMLGRICYQAKLGAGRHEIILRSDAASGHTQGIYILRVNEQAMRLVVE